MERYTYVGGQKLRCGYTTGSCAAAASKAAVSLLLTGKTPEYVELLTPKGVRLSLLTQKPKHEHDWAECAVQKDAGDDPDVTNGIFVFARVRYAAQGVSIKGGTGVGHVTRAGLDCPVGSPAINHVPRKMITQAVTEVCSAYGYGGGIIVELSIPGGDELAKKTYNPRLGIVGGLSILGTSGIVEPMSERALIDSIRVEMDMCKAAGTEYLIVTPGNYGEVFAAKTLGFDPACIVKCSNFVGETLDYAVQLAFKGILLVGHLGKFVKLAGGIFNTHSREADCRMELLTAHAALAGAAAPLIQLLMSCVTTDEAIELLEGSRLREAVMCTIMEKIGFHIRTRIRDTIPIGAIVFSNHYGILGKNLPAGLLSQFD